MYHLVIILFTCFSYILCVTDNNSLQLIHFFFRHGERAPTRTYTNDPYRDYEWSNGWDQLTNRGKKEMYDLGLKLRRIYAEFLSEYYLPNETYVYSSYADRCHMSAQSLLAGLYPPYKEQIWNSEMPWQPVPVNDIPRHLDNLIAMKRKCPAYEKALNDTYSSPKIKEIDKANADLYKYLTSYTGDNISNVLAVELLYNTLEIEKLHNLTLPIWTQSVFPERMRELAALSLAVFTDTQFMKRMKGGVFIKQVISHMNDKRNNTSNRKLYLYAGHDISIVNIHRALGFDDLIKPGFGASLTTELHKINDNYVVKMFYRSNSTDDAEELQLESCPNPCSLDSFGEALQSVLPGDWEKECELS